MFVPAGLHRFFVACGLVAVVAGGGRAAHAQTWQLEVGTGLARYQAEERSAGGGLLNREQGTLTRWQGSATRRWAGDQAGDAERLLTLKWQTDGAPIDYQGVTQGGLPLVTQTRFRATTWQARLDWRWTQDNAQQWLLGLGLRQTRLDRDIQAAPGSVPLQEVLNATHVDLVAGWRAPVPVPHWTKPPVFSVQARLSPSLRQKLHVNTHGLYDPITLSPQGGVDWGLETRLDWALSSRTQFWLALSHDRFNPGASAQQIWTRNGVPVSTVQYPGSRQQTSSISAGLRMDF